MGVLSKIFKNWEYWPSYMFYIPNLPYAFYLAFKARNPVFYSIANPAIKFSGNGSESKYASLQLIPKDFRPVTVYIKKNAILGQSIDLFKSSNLKFPVIAKPDIGFRGLLVNLIKNEQELLAYLKKNDNIDILIQEFISFNHEWGIFYSKMPDEELGEISSITIKKYLSVEGNGRDSLKTLIFNDARASRYYDLLKDQHRSQIDTILPADEVKTLTIIGNHCKGAQFIDGNHHIDLELTTAIDKIFRRIPNWYYGRLDLKFDNLDDLKKLKSFKIIELNGIISEPTHIYDAANSSYGKALKEIRRHWNKLYRISKYNHDVTKIKYDSVFEFLKSIRTIKRHTATIKSSQIKA